MKYNPYNTIDGITCPSCDDVEMQHQPDRTTSAGILICPDCGYSEDADMRR